MKLSTTTKFEGNEQIVIRLTNPVDVERGALYQGSVLIADNDPFDPKLLDDFEQGAFLWEGADWSALRPNASCGDATHVPARMPSRRAHRNDAWRRPRSGHRQTGRHHRPGGTTAGEQPATQRIQRNPRHRTQSRPRLLVNGFFLDPKAARRSSPVEHSRSLWLSVSGRKRRRAGSQSTTPGGRGCQLAGLALAVARNNGVAWGITLAQHAIDTPSVR